MTPFGYGQHTNGFWRKICEDARFSSSDLCCPVTLFGHFSSSPTSVRGRWWSAPQEWEHDAVTFILDQFPIIRRKDEERYGTYRTKETMLQRYDQMCR
ncbi:MAG: hypothetical protein KatS3mg038_2694 [Candidatus Kapaibacterium sp.]|nr:MAG: hypothetical protein KatS3mg038_2694 [Candidatus Kapabacteria bacterium]